MILIQIQHPLPLISILVKRKISLSLCFCVPVSTELCLKLYACVLMCVWALMHTCLASAGVGVLAVLHRSSERCLASAGWQVDMQCRRHVMPFPSGEMPIPRYTHIYPPSIYVYLAWDQHTQGVPVWPPSLWEFQFSSVCTAPSTYHPWEEQLKAC